MTRLRRHRGAALIMSLALLFVVAAAGAALCLRVSETARSNVAERWNVAARCAAQAGVERARATLAGDAAYAGETFRFDAFDVVVGVTPAPDGYRAVRSTATSPAARAVVEAKLRLGSGLPTIESWRE